MGESNWIKEFDPLWVCNRIHSVEPMFVKKNGLKYDKQNRRHEKSRKQDAYKFAQKKLPAGNRFAHECDSGTPFDFFTYRNTSCQGSKHHRCKHDGIVTQFFDHDEIFAEGEVRNKRRNKEGKRARLERSQNIGCLMPSRKAA